MSIAISEFWTRLVQTGLFDPDGCGRLSAAYQQAHGGQAPQDSRALAKFLVKSKRLTKFQGKALLGEAPPAIRFGQFVQTSDQPSFPLGHWLPVQTVGPSPTGVQRPGFLLRVPAAQLTDYLNQWLAAHAGVAAESLQPFELYGAPGTNLEIFSRLKPGQSLAEHLANGPIDRRQAVEVGIAVSNALTKMHERGLMHGEVRADRVWLTSDGEVVLLRDPSSAPRTPRMDASLSWLQSTEHPGGYAAPEFADPNLACNPGTDVYSLGCLLFHMVVGKAPVEGENVDQMIAAQLASTPSEVTQAVQQGEAGDPVLRVAAFAMAKNPAGRFAATQQIADAMNAVLASLSTQTNTTQANTASARPAAAAPPSVEAPPAPVEAPAAPVEAPAAPVETPAAPVAAPPSSKSAIQAAGDQQAVSKSPARRKKKKRRSTQTPAAQASPPPRAASPPPSQPEPSQPEPSQPAEPDSQPPPVAASAVEAAAAASAASSVSPPPTQVAPAHPEPPQTPPEPPPVKTPTSPSAEPPEPPPPTAVQPPPAPPIIADEGAGSDATTSGGSSTRTLRKRRKKKNPLPLILGILSVPVLGLLVGLLVYNQAPPERKPGERPPIPEVVPEVASSNRSVGPTESESTPRVARVPAKPKVEGGYEVASDGEFLWVPPHEVDSPNAPLDLLPPGPAVIVSMRLNKLLNDPAGRDMVAALSPELAGLIKQAADRAGVPAVGIERLSAALHPGAAGWPEVSLAVELVEAKTVKELSDIWGATMGKTEDGSTIYGGDELDSDAFYLGDSQKGSMAPDAPVKRFAVGSLNQIKGVAENEGGGIPLPRSLQKLWETTSKESDVVALVTPNFLFADGRGMIQSVAPEMEKPLKSILIPDFAGMLVTVATKDGNVYTEMRGVPSGGTNTAMLMTKMSDAIKQWPGWAEGFVVDASPDRSWKLLATRLPQMMRFFIEQTRFGVENDTVVANTYLPGNAASQISLATLLAMNTKPGVAAAETVATTGGDKPLSLDEMLDRKMSIAFDQLSLEFAINEVVTEFQQSLPAGSKLPPFRLMGSDLKQMGITQNQQIRDFTRTDMPLRAVLTDLVRGANPDKTATGADDPKQALVWALDMEAEVPGGIEILVTTRPAAEQNKYRLPVEFEIKK